MKLRLRKREKITILLLLVNAIGFIILFIYDLKKYSDLSNRLVIGTVEYKNNIIQRKLDGNIVWETLNKNSLIVNRDTIRSDSRSDAMIRLNNDTVILVDENTMFLLDVTSSKPGINISSGNVSINKPKSSKDEFLIQTSNSLIALQEGQISISKKNSDEFTIHLEEGKAAIAKKGKYIDIESGNLVEVSENDLKFKKIPFKILSPSNNQFFTTQTDSYKVVFRWKPIATYTSHKLEIANTPNFDSIIKTIEYPSQEVSISLPLGTYYWRIIEKQASSPIYKFQIIQDVPQDSNLPSHQEVLSYVEKPPSVYFQWDSDPLAKDYELEIAEDSSFKKKSLKIKSQVNYISIDELDSGEYYWRVRTNPIQENLPTKITPIKKLTIQKTMTYPPPKLVRPINERIEEEIFLKNGIFIWNGNKEFQSYELQVSMEQEFQKPIIKQSLKENFWKPESKWKPGEYYWRVRGITESGNSSNYSPIAFFQILSKDNQNTELAIESSPSSLDKEVSNQLEISKIKERDSAPTEMETKSIIVYPKNTVIDLSGKKSIRFEWTHWKNKKQEEYILSIFTEKKAGIKPILQIKTTSLFYELNNLGILQEGTINWEVAVTKGEKILYKESSKVILSIEKLKNLKPEDIQFITPPVLYKEAQK